MVAKIELREPGPPVRQFDVNFCYTPVRTYLLLKSVVQEKSALCEHLMLFDQCISWKESTVLKYGNSYRKRLIAESWFINAHPNVINSSDGETLPSVN